MLGKHKETKKEVAIKFMDISESLHNSSHIEDIYKEADSLMKLNHKSIIALYNAFVEKKQVCMIMEYAGGGELLDFVQERGHLTEIEGRRVFQQLVSALSYCHGRGIVHRDMKLENVLVKSKEDLQIKVVDFGIAGVCTTKKSEKVDAGSIAYMPPEVLDGSKTETSPAIDVWAIGLMYYAMLFGTLPFWGDTEDEFIDAICTQPLKFPKDIPLTAMCKEILKGTTHKDPEKRLTLYDVMCHDYYKMEDEDLVKMIQETEQKFDEAK